MTFRWSRRRVVHALLWCGLAVALLTISIPGIYRGATAYPLRRGGALHSTDSYLKFSTGAEGASENLIAMFASMPPSKPILIFIKKGDPYSSGLGMTAAYLAWPNVVRLFEIDGTHPDNTLSICDPNKIAGVVLCRMTRPAWLPRGKMFGSGLEVVPLAKK